MRITVVGLGPGAMDWVTPAAHAGLPLPGSGVFVRTRFCPNLDKLLAGVEWESFDDLYEQAESLADLDLAMAQRLLGTEGATDPGDVGDVQLDTKESARVADNPPGGGRFA